jgi:hypothetical protein
MSAKRKILLLFSTFFLFSIANAQFDFSYISVKGFSGFGGGSFLDLGILIRNGDIIMAEPNCQFFGKGDVFIFPVLAGYRHYLSGKGHGLYMEPLAGYTFGSTSITQTNASGTPVTDGRGDTLSQKGNGFTAGIGVGYSFQKFPAYGIEFKYEHIFLPGHPQINILSFGLSYMILLKRRPGHDF